jgi:hypothetical protein
VRKSKLPLKKLYTLVRKPLKKQKIGSSFKLLREDLSRKASIACAILWNFWVLATYLFLLFLSGSLHYSYAKGSGRFLEQPPKVLDKAKKWMYN